MILGPFRVLPGRLSVSRTFGDIEAKKTKYGGNPKVVIAEPDIKSFKVLQNYDFIILACKSLFSSLKESLGDGVFDKMDNKDVNSIAWDSAKKNFRQKHKIHSICGSSVEMVLKASIASRSLDNVTAVLVSFKNFKKTL